ncbi:hypothetical protein SRHO_G00083280 [Serrasalmus rhombeus]
MRRTDEDRRSDINERKMKQEWERRRKLATEKEEQKHLWKEHLRCLEESDCSSSLEENLQWDRTQKNRTVIQKRDQQLQQDMQEKHNQALQKEAAEEAGPGVGDQ